jgi:Uma2 family endonuclease
MPPQLISAQFIGGVAMALPQSRIYITPEDYLAFEREAEERHEYEDGRIYEMAGESPEHSTICFNLAVRIGSQLLGKSWRGFSPNIKVRVNLSGKFFYPDLAIVCGEPRFHDARRDVLLNPRAIFEVLSPTTERKDRGEKFFRYQQIDSLNDYLLVSQELPLIEHYVRQEHDRWLYAAHADLTAQLYIPAIDCELKLAEVYELVVFPPNDEEEQFSSETSSTPQ